MNFLKTAILCLGIGILVLVIGAHFYYKNDCKEPDTILVQRTQVKCANESLNSEEVAREACLVLKGQEVCDFVEEDLEALTKFFYDVVNKCTDEVLEKQKFCTNKYKKLK